jgi:hypothetical protein
MQSYRVNLSAAIFPMTLADAGQSVIINGIDQNFDKRVDSPGDQTKNAGIPQILFAKNVLPASEGYESAGYVNSVGVYPASAGYTVFHVLKFNPVDTVNPSAKPSGKQIVLTAYKNSGGLFQYFANYDDYSQNSVTVTGISLNPANYDNIAVVTVKDKTFLFVRNGGTSALFSLSITTAGASLTGVTATNVTGSVTGFTFNNVVYISAAYNYLVAVWEDAGLQYVYWSSTTTLLDFAPSLVSGAGREIPSMLRSAVKFIKQHPDGFIIYTEYNAVSAVYTGNPRYPFKFREVLNSGGFNFSYQVSGSLSGNEHYGIDNTNKLMLMNIDESRLYAPELSTFLERYNSYDTFDSNTNTFSVTVVDRSLEPQGAKIYFLLDRYLLLDFGAPGAASQPQTIVYDTLLSRYGKLTVDSAFVTDSLKKIVFHSSTSATKQLVMGYENAPAAQYDSALLLGRFQLARDVFIELHEVNIQSAQGVGITGAANFTLFAYGSLDGVNFQPAEQFIENSYQPSSGINRRFFGRTGGENVCVLVKGAFKATSAEIVFSNGGNM